MLRARLPIILSSLVFAGCAGKLETPIPTALHQRAEPERARVLLVMLPGAGDRVGTYQKHGFVDSMRQTGMDVDMLEVDAHYRYYRSRTLLDRMHEDVLAPNRDRYDEIWIVGISMGGIGALLTAERFPEDVDGLILIAPYLGRRKTLTTIDAAGGLEVWEPPAEIPASQWDVEIWAMLDRIAQQGGAGEIELYLMYGEDDFGVRAHQLLADALPDERVKTAPGGHAWTTWTVLWDELMAEAPIARDEPDEPQAPDGSG